MKSQKGGIGAQLIALILIIMGIGAILTGAGIILGLILIFIAGRIIEMDDGIY